MFSIVVEVEGKRKISAFPATYFKAGNTRNYYGGVAPRNKKDAPIIALTERTKDERRVRDMIK